MKNIAFVTYPKAPNLTPDDALAIAPLQELDIEVMPAIWNDPAVNWKYFDAVIKPMISATAHQTYRISPATARDDQSRLDEILRHSGVMIQKFVDEITTAGEWSLVFFAGKFSHAVLKRPRDGDFRVQADFGGTYQPLPPPPELIKQAEAILGLIDQPLLYARVDGVNSEGHLVLIELELIEPQLFLKMDAAAPRRFAEAIRLFDKPRC